MNVDNWEGCTTDELLELEKSGTYMQRTIAKRYLDDKRKDAFKRAHAADAEGDMREADLMRAHLKYLGA